jgi:hypothetical protein
MKHLFNFWKCWGKSHKWKHVGITLGGTWVECQRCYTLDEYLPGLHEPEGASDAYKVPSEKNPD